MPASTNGPPPVALTIAGSDSGGGAGIQADLKTFHQFGVFGTSALTAVTAQNTLGVTAVHTIPVAVLRAQVLAVTTDLPPAAVKTGMLGTEAHVVAVAELAAQGLLPNLVVDPVMVATSGDRLLDAGAERAICERLFPHATLVTPNLREAEILVGRVIETRADMEACARALVEMGAGAALVKGGHGPAGAIAAESITDILYHGASYHPFQHVRHSTRHTHGTGCTLSAAATAALARGNSVLDATRVAIRFVTDAIGRAPGLGGGSGPIDHFTPAPG